MTGCRLLNRSLRLCLGICQPQAANIDAMVANNFKFPSVLLIDMTSFYRLVQIVIFPRILQLRFDGTGTMQPGHRHDAAWGNSAGPGAPVAAAAGIGGKSGAPSGT